MNEKMAPSPLSKMRKSGKQRGYELQEKSAHEWQIKDLVAEREPSTGCAWGVEVNRVRASGGMIIILYTKMKFIQGRNKWLGMKRIRRGMRREKEENWGRFAI